MKTLYEFEKSGDKRGAEIHKLSNLSWHQKHLLIQRDAEHAEELKEIWRKTWGIEYPYISDMNNNVFKVGG